MKNSIFLRYIIVSAVSCFGLVSMSACNDPKSPPEVTVPSVGIVVEKSSTHSVTFSITVENADKAAWAVFEKGKTAPTPSSLFMDGEAVDMTIDSPVEKDGLQPATAYVVYAVAANGEMESKVASADFSTEADTEVPEPLEFISVVEVGKNSYTYHIETEDGVLYRHMALPKQVLDNYTSLWDGNEAAAMELLLGIYGASGEGASDYTVTSPTAKPMLDVVAGLDYLVVACVTDAAGVATAAYEKLAFRTLEPAVAKGSVDIGIERLAALECDFSYAVAGDIALIWDNVLFADDYAAILKDGGEQGLKAHLTATGNRSASFGDVAEWGGLEEKTEYVLCVLGIDSAGDHTELYQLPFTTTELDGVQTEGILFDRYIDAFAVGEVESGAHEYLISFADCLMEESEYGDYYPADGGEGVMLFCDLYTEPSADGRIPEGEYKFSNDSEIGTWNPYDTWAACFNKEGEMIPMEFVAGTIEVSYGDKGYVIEFNLTGTEDEHFTGTFEGDITFAADFSSAAVRSGLKNSRGVRR